MSYVFILKAAYMTKDIDEQQQWDEPCYEPNEELQREYESALGRFLVAFNNIESSSSWLIEEAIKKAGRDSIPKEIKDNDNYSFKVNVLDLISLFSKRVASEELVNELR